MTHLSTEALLGVREPGAEPGDAAAREHLEACALCQAEFDRLHQRIARLKALPPLRPRRDLWPAVAARLRAERRWRRARVAGLAGLAAAASVALGLTIRSPSPLSPDVATTEQIHQAMERSQALESALSRYHPESRVVDGRTARIAEELEDRIARVDRALEATELSPQQTDDQDVLKLWRERVGLLDALVDVHVTRASDAGL